MRRAPLPFELKDLPHPWGMGGIVLTSDLSPKIESLGALANIPSSSLVSCRRVDAMFFNLELCVGFGILA